MPDAIQSLARAAVAGRRRTIGCQTGKLYSSRPWCFRSGRTRSDLIRRLTGSWVMVGNAEFEEAAQEFVGTGWLFSAGGLIEVEGSAFGCDSKGSGAGGQSSVAEGSGR